MRHTHLEADSAEQCSHVLVRAAAPAVLPPHAAQQLQYSQQQQQAQQHEQHAPPGPARLRGAACHAAAQDGALDRRTAVAWRQARNAVCTCEVRAVMQLMHACAGTGCPGRTAAVGRTWAARGHTAAVAAAAMHTTERQLGRHSTSKATLKAGLRIALLESSPVEPRRARQHTRVIRAERAFRAGGADERCSFCKHACACAALSALCACATLSCVTKLTRVPKGCCCWQDIDCLPAAGRC